MEVTTDYPPTLTEISKRLHGGEKGITPFNWEIEFPEVFEWQNSGFDCFIENPPFLGGKSISTNVGSEYLAWILEQHPEANGNADLVAYFFRKAFAVSRRGESFGLIATNTIAQADTGSSGLRYICQQKGTIYNAQKRLKWTGLAAVVVSVVNIYKGKYLGSKTLNNKPRRQNHCFSFSYWRQRRSKSTSC